MQTISITQKRYSKKDIAFSNIEKWTVVLLVLLSFTGVSVASIGKALLTPFHLAMGGILAYSLFVSQKANKKISVSLLLFMAYVLLVNVIQFPNIRYTSVLYTLIYGVEMSILLHLLRRCKLPVILFAFELIVYLYFVNLLLGFTFDAVGLKSDAILKIIRVYYAKGVAGGRPMGFSSEPSYAAFILSVVLLSYTHLTKHALDKRNFRMFALVLLSILLSKSAYGLLFLMVIIVDWIIHFYRNGDVLLKNIFPAVLLIGFMACYLLVSNSDNEVLQRILKFSTVLIDKTTTGESKMIKLQEADGSAFARIAPSYLLFFHENDYEFNYLLGQGAGSAGIFLSTFLTGILVDEGRTSVDTGIMPALIFDYGYIGGLLFLIYLIASFYRLPFSFWLLFLLVIPNANINTQIIWFTIACFSFVSIVPSYKTHQHV